MVRWPESLDQMSTAAVRWWLSQSGDHCHTARDHCRSQVTIIIQSCDHCGQSCDHCQTVRWPLSNCQVTSRTVRWPLSHTDVTTVKVGWPLSNTQVTLNRQVISVTWSALGGHSHGQMPMSHGQCSNDQVMSVARSSDHVRWLQPHGQVTIQSGDQCQVTSVTQLGDQYQSGD